MGDLTTTKYIEFMNQARGVRATGQTMTLMVGDRGKLDQTYSKADTDCVVFFVEYKELTKEFLKAFDPSVIVSPIMSASFDCLDLASFLEENGFAGQYRVSLHGIPLPGIVTREVRQQHPNLDFDVMHNLAHVTAPARYM